MSEPVGEPPALRIVRGEPTPEEVAALAVIMRAAAANAAAADRGSPRGRWNDPSYTHRRHWAVQAGGWLSAR